MKTQIKPQRREGRGGHRLLASLRALRVSAFNLGVLGLLLAGALLWARGRDPFERRWFKVHPAGSAAAECVAILPKTAAWPLPVVVWLHGSGGSVPGSGDDMRQMAELGLAVVGLEYEQRSEDGGRRTEDGGRKTEDRGQKTEDGGRKTEDGFEGQFTALLEYLQHQAWADTNRVAWAGYSLGAQRELAFFLRHPERRPKLLVRRGGGWVPELKSEVQSLKSKVAPPFEVQGSALDVRRSPGAVPAPPFEVQGSGFEVQGSALDVRRSPEAVPAPPFKVQGSGFKVQGSTLDVRRSPDAVPAPPFEVQGSGFKVQGSRSRPTTVLLLHGEHDEVFPLSEAERVAACLRSNGVPVELRILPGEGHGGPNGLVVCRMIGEQCLARLNGPEAWSHYRSIGQWQAAAWPLWVFLVPALVWAGLWLCLRVAPGFQPAGEAASLPPVGSGAGAGMRRAPAGWKPGATVAAGLAAAALAVTAWHVVPPRLAIGGRTLAFAREHLVPPGERSDFDFLAAQPCWRGQPLKTLLEEVQLAGYNRELVNWKVDDGLYRQFVLSPVIEPSPKSKADGSERHELHEFTRTPPGPAAGTAAPLWRRVLWESCYPQVRREQDPAAAAEIVVRFLRERVTIPKESRKQKVESRNRRPVVSGQGQVAASGEGRGDSNQWSVVGNQWPGPGGVAGAWERQITDERGFEALYVAAMRSVGVPCRLGLRGRAEFWTGSAWQPAPRPLVEGWE